MVLGRLVLVAALSAGFAACGGGDTSVPRGGRPQVVASFYPLAYVVAQVGGELVDAANLTPPGAEPHDLELTASQIRALADADLVVYLGDGFQPSVEDALAGINAEVVDALDTPQALHETDEHETDEHGAVDPHVWLDPTRLAAIAGTVAARLADLAPGEAERFRANASELVAELEALDADFRNGLAECDRSTIVTSHEAFGYLAGAYGLEEVGVAGIDPEAEPSPRRLAEVAEFVRTTGVTTIFFEVLVSPRTAETLAREAGVGTARLDPLEGPPEDGDYLTAMRANLGALRQGLGCT